MSDRQPIIVSPQDFKNQQISESKRIAAEQFLDEGPEGGRYQLADGSFVDANGNPVKDEKANDKPAEESPVRDDMPKRVRG